MGILDDDSLDARAKKVLAKKRGAPSVDLLERVALLLASPSPQMLQDAADWLAIIDALAAAGLTPEQTLHVALRASQRGAKDTFAVFPPDTAILRHLFSIDAGLDIARAVGDELIANPLAPDDDRAAFYRHKIGNAALARIAADGAIESRLESLFDWFPIDPVTLHAIVTGIPADRREHFLASRLSSVDPSNAAFRADQLLWIVDVVPSIRARIDALLVAAKDDEDPMYDALAAEVAANTTRTLESLPTPKALAAIQFWKDRTAHPAAMTVSNVTKAKHPTKAKSPAKTNAAKTRSSAKTKSSAKTTPRAKTKSRSKTTSRAKTKPPAKRTSRKS